jgi:hypothetical protein
VIHGIAAQHVADAEIGNCPTAETGDTDEHETESNREHVPLMRACAQRLGLHR